MRLKVPVAKEDHIEGNEQAAIAFVEYGDYECQDCGNAYAIIKEVQEHFKKDLKFVFRNFPIKERHPYAKIAAEVAEFSGEKGHFWEMHDLIYENQEILGMPLLIELTQTLGLPIKDLELALQNGTFDAQIQKDISSGIKSGVNKTPTFFINDERYDGNVEFDELVIAINSFLKNRHLA